MAPSHEFYTIYLFSEFLCIRQGNMGSPQGFSVLLQ